MIPTTEEIVNEIKMRYDNTTDPFLLVEGPSDVTFFSLHMTLGIENMLPAFGWENVVAATATLQAEGKERILGVIDLDYRGIVSSSSLPASIVKTDSHDLETMMLSSPAFNKVLGQKGSRYKVRAYPKGNNGIRSRILKLGRPIGSLRFYSQLRSRQYSFQNLDIEKFIDRKTLSFSPKKFIAHLRGLSANNSSIPDGIVRDAEAKVRNIPALRDPYRLCCGHDLMGIMAMGLKSVWGTHSSKAMSGKLLEELFMLAYAHQTFRDTGLCQQIDKWFQDKGFAPPWIE